MKFPKFSELDSWSPTLHRASLDSCLRLSEIILLNSIEMKKKSLMTVGWKTRVKLPLTARWKTRLPTTIKQTRDLTSETSFLSIPFQKMTKVTSTCPRKVNSMLITHISQPSNAEERRERHPSLQLLNYLSRPSERRTWLEPMVVRQKES